MFTYEFTYTGQVPCDLPFGAKLSSTGQSKGKDKTSHDYCQFVTY